MENLQYTAATQLETEVVAAGTLLPSSHHARRPAL